VTDGTNETADLAHLSIGEVLAELRDEFPDITISKIRFLESQGLVNPERTPSGYRKFYDADLVRLRWILHQQKEHFLPLKVIKERLDQLPPGGEALLLDPAPATDIPATDIPATDIDAPTELPVDEALAPRAAAEPPARSAQPAVAPAPSRQPAAASTRQAAPAPVRRRTPAFAPDLPLDTDASDDVLAPASGDGYTRDELAKAAGLEPAQVAQLESYGMLAPARQSPGGDAEYDDDALEVARVAAGLFARGVEARHLRMYRNHAEREAVLFGQVLMPYVRQRNPEARARMHEELVELAALGRRLRTVLLREAVRDALAE
jgi:DNA-binding transcriptional MerR regulator